MSIRKLNELKELSGDDWRVKSHNRQDGVYYSLQSWESRFFGKFQEVKMFMTNSRREPKSRIEFKFLKAYLKTRDMNLEMSTARRGMWNSRSYHLKINTTYSITTDTLVEILYALNSTQAFKDWKSTLSSVERDRIRYPMMRPLGYSRRSRNTEIEEEYFKRTLENEC